MPAGDVGDGNAKNILQAFDLRGAGRGTMIEGEASERGRWSYLMPLFYLLTAGMIAYQMFYIFFQPWEPTKHAIIHLGFVLTLTLLWKYRQRLGFIHLIGVLIVIASTYYFFFFYDDILELPSYPPTPSLIAGVGIFLVVLILVQQSYGWFFFMVAVLSVAYMSFGHYLPGLLRSPEIDIRRLIGYISSDVTSPWGIYGGLIGLSANYLFLFLVFGSCLEASGGLRFANAAGSFFASKLRSGPAALSVFSSALIGMFTGSTVANITITGAFTIPLMKKTGYKPEQAAAIETLSSSGGQILPPIMGTTAFVLASYTNIPYINIAKVSIIPALIYFSCILLYAELNARRLNIAREEKRGIQDRRGFLCDGIVFISSLLTISIMLVKGFSPMATIFWALVVVMGLGLINVLRPHSGLKLVPVLKSVARGVSSACEISVILALIGVIVGAVETTGLSMNMGLILVKLAGNSLFLLLLMAGVSALLLGMAVPSMAAYMITATILSPGLIKMGVPLLQAHLFPMFYAVFSHITPPIALGLMVACKMASAEYLPASKEALKGASVSYLLPFFFIYTPIILLQSGGNSPAFWQFSAIIISLVVSSAILNNQWAGRLKTLDRVLLLIADVMVFLFIFGPQHFGLLVAGGLLGGLGLGLNYLHTVRDKNK